MDRNALVMDPAQAQREKQRLLYHDKCDRYDYLAAVGCGVVGGVIDIFLVGTPGSSSLGNWTDQQVDSAVKSFARLLGWSPREGKENSVASAIGFLEKRFKVNYDQRHTADVGNRFRMNTRNHHIMNLAHSPDIVGLFFSILAQFTSTSTFVAEGQLIAIKTESFELQGGNFIAKLFCGVANWFGHIMSDIAGSSGSRGNGGRGAGIAIPFYELLQFCKFGRFNVEKDKQDIATIAVRAFQEGYDFRFGAAMAIPVAVTDLSIRLIWSLRRYFQDEMPLRECMPTNRHDNLRIMLLIGNGTLCVMDGADAAARSGGNALLFFTRLNLIGWFRLVKLVLKEICIRFDISDDIEYNLEAMKRTNLAIEECLAQMKELDIQGYHREAVRYKELCGRLERAESEEELTRVFLQFYAEKGYALPWKGDFDAHMSNKSNRLVFGGR